MHDSEVLASGQKALKRPSFIFSISARRRTGKPLQAILERLRATKLDVATLTTADTMTDTTVLDRTNPKHRHQLGSSLSLIDAAGTMIVFDPKRV